MQFLSSKYLLWRTIVQLGIVIAIIFYWIRINRINEMVDGDMIGSFEVINKTCRRSKGGSNITIRYNLGTAKIEYYGQKCFDLEVGSNIELYYHKEVDIFHVPGSPVYERYVYALIFVFVLTFIPWNKLPTK